MSLQMLWMSVAWIDGYGLGLKKSQSVGALDLCFSLNMALCYANHTYLLGSRTALSRRLYVVEVEEVGRIVLILHGEQSLVVLAVRRLCLAFPLFS